MTDGKDPTRELVVGDTVMLRSGGPWMTIENIRGEHADCSWFDDDKNALASQFPLACLDTIRRMGR